MIKKFYKKLIIYCLILSGLFCGMLNISVAAEQSVLLKGGIEKVPNTFFGSWRVVSTRTATDSPVTFKQKGLDLWNLSQDNNVIKLNNPFSGASAEVKIQNVSNNRVEFTKNGKYGNKMLSDTVKITISGDKFTGVDIIKLETLSDVDGSIRKTETAKYEITGERISGQSITEN